MHYCFTFVSEMRMILVLLYSCFLIVFFGNNSQAEMQYHTFSNTIQLHTVGQNGIGFSNKEHHKTILFIEATEPDLEEESSEHDDHHDDNARLFSITHPSGYDGISFRAVHHAMINFTSTKSYHHPYWMLSLPEIYLSTRSIRI